LTVKRRNNKNKNEPVLITDQHQSRDLQEFQFEVHYFRQKVKSTMLGGDIAVGWVHPRVDLGQFQVGTGWLDFFSLFAALACVGYDMSRVRRLYI